jgi:hypothetical protein
MFSIPLGTSLDDVGVAVFRLVAVRPIYSLAHTRRSAECLHGRQNQDGKCWDPTCVVPLKYYFCDTNT